MAVEPPRVGWDVVVAGYYGDECRQEGRRAHRSPLLHFTPLKIVSGNIADPYGSSPEMRGHSYSREVSSILATESAIVAVSSRLHSRLDGAKASQLR